MENNNNSNQGKEFFCQKCGAKLEKPNDKNFVFCTECGTRFDFPEATPQPETNDVKKTSQTHTQAPTSATKKSKGVEILGKAKDFAFKNKKLSLIALGIVIVLILILAFSCSNSGKNKLIWPKDGLGAMLPTPDSQYGEIVTNSSSTFKANVEKTSETDFEDYISKCKEAGFDVDYDSNSTSYDAENKDGYQLSLYYYSSKKEMSISLDEPVKKADYGSYKWPEDGLAVLLPEPKLKNGEIESNNSETFIIYLANCTRSDYKEYVDACVDKGFNVDSYNGDNYFYADDSKGNSLRIDYDEKREEMTVQLTAYEEPKETTKAETTKPETTAPVTEKPVETTAAPAQDSGTVNPSLKEALDSYESFMNEYVEFMKRYESNPDDWSLLADYADWLQRYSDMIDKINNLDTDSFTTADWNYYIEVTTRVSAKLAEIGE